jgi:hypothetical protein
MPSIVYDDGLSYRIVSSTSHDTGYYRGIYDEFYQPEWLQYEFSAYPITTNNTNTITITSVTNLAVGENNMPRPVPPNITNLELYTKYLFDWFKYEDSGYNALGFSLVLEGSGVLKIQNTEVRLTIGAIDSSNLRKLKISVKVPQKLKVEGLKYNFYTTSTASGAPRYGLKSMFKDAFNAWNASMERKTQLEQEEANHKEEVALAEKRAEERLTKFKATKVARANTFDNVISRVINDYKTVSVLEDNFINVELDNGFKLRIQAEVDGAKVAGIECDNVFINHNDLASFINKIKSI